jgi:acyl dehydratase
VLPGAAETLTERDVKAVPAEQWSFADFGAGQVFESQSRTITESDVVLFAAWSWDANPVHTDAVGQESSRFGQRIAHGLLGLSVALGLASRIGIFEACSIALLGVDDWRFVRAVLIGDTVRVRVTITGTRLTSRGDSGVLQRRFELVNQHDEVVQEGRLDLLVST